MDSKKEFIGRLTRTLLFILVPLVLIIFLHQSGAVGSARLDATADDFKTLKIKPIKEIEALGALTTLVFMALLLERVLEVFVNAWRRTDTVKMEAQMDRLMEKIRHGEEDIRKFTDQQLIKALTASQKKALKGLEETLKANESSLEKLEDKVLDYKSKTHLFTIRIALAISILVSLVGLRVLEVFFTQESLAAVQGWQRIFFEWLDVMLTAGVIAGGSEGIHYLTTIYKNATTRTASKLEKG